MDAHPDFLFALADGLGANQAKNYVVTPYEFHGPAALAYSTQEKILFLLTLAAKSDVHLTESQYLDLAKQLSNDFRAFVVPGQNNHGHVLWAGKTRGPVISFKFNVLRRPDFGFVKKP